MNDERMLRKIPAVNRRNHSIALSREVLRFPRDNKTVLISPTVKCMGYIFKMWLSCYLRILKVKPEAQSWLKANCLYD